MLPGDGVNSTEGGNWDLISLVKRTPTEVFRCFPPPQPETTSTRRHPGALLEPLASRGKRPCEPNYSSDSKNCSRNFKLARPRLRDLEQEEARLRDTLLRISGAIQVLDEELARAASLPLDEPAPAGEDPEGGHLSSPGSSGTALACPCDSFVEEVAAAARSHTGC